MKCFGNNVHVFVVERCHVSNEVQLCAARVVGRGKYWLWSEVDSWTLVVNEMLWEGMLTILL